MTARSYHPRILILLALWLFAALSNARADNGEILLQIRKTVAPAVKRGALRGASTWLFASARIGGTEVLFHAYQTPPDREGERATWLDVFQGSRRLHRTRLEDFRPTEGAQPSLLWLEPQRKRGPMLVFQRANEDLLVAVFPRGVTGEVHVQHWQTGESGSYWMHYDLGPTDDKGFRTIQVECQDSNGTETTLSRWKGNRFE